MKDRFREWNDDWLIGLFRPEIEDFIREYPEVVSEEATLDKLLNKRMSISRFGDGELKLMVGERHKSFQDVKQNMNQRMLEVLRSNDPNVLIATHPVRDFDGLGRIWSKYIIRIGTPVLELLDKDRVYESTGVFHLLPGNDSEAFSVRIRSIKRLWQDRKVLFVVGKNSRFHLEPELFDNVASIDYVYGPARNAFAEYDRLIEEVRQWDKSEYLVLLVLGPTATIMAYDLGREGYQAIDFGQMPGKFAKLASEYRSRGMLVDVSANKEP